MQPLRIALQPKIGQRLLLPVDKGIEERPLEQILKHPFNLKFPGNRLEHNLSLPRHKLQRQAEIPSKPQHSTRPATAIADASSWGRWPDITPQKPEEPHRVTGYEVNETVSGGVGRIRWVDRCVGICFGALAEVSGQGHWQ